MISDADFVLDPATQQEVEGMRQAWQASYAIFVRERFKFAELLAALEPFADIVSEGDEDYADDKTVVVTFGRVTHYALKLGDLRRAQAVFSKAAS